MLPCEEDRHSVTFIVSGSGKPLRQFIYSIDLVKAGEYDAVESVILSGTWLLWCGFVDSSVIVGEDEEVSVKEVADAIVKAVNWLRRRMLTHSSSELTLCLYHWYGATRADDRQFCKPASNKKSLTLIGSFEITPFDKALHDTVSWFSQNYDTARTGLKKSS